jgi:hypothetical protein
MQVKIDRILSYVKNQAERGYGHKQMLENHEQKMSERGKGTGVLGPKLVQITEMV